jgi:endoglucanase
VTRSPEVPARTLRRLAASGLLAAACLILLAAVPRPASAAVTTPAFTNPTNGRVGVDTTKPFAWTTVPGAQGYYLTVGTTLGGYDLLNSGVLPASQVSYEVPLLPTGETLYARIYAELGGSFTNYQDIAFTAAGGGEAVFTNPTTGQVAVDTTKPFTWSTVAAAQGYYLMIGTSLGADDLLNSGGLAATQSSYETPLLPTGKTLYARIYTELAGAYTRYEDVTFTAAPGGEAVLRSPTAGQTLVGATQPFAWTAVAAAQGYYLTIGTTLGGSDLLNSGVLAASQSSYNPLTLPAGKPLYARIYTELGGSFARYEDVAFQVTDPPLAALTVTGNQILANGVPFHFHGVNRDSLEWGSANWGGCGGDGHFTDADFDNMMAWHVTAVRLPLSEADWLGRRCSAASYVQYVDAAVAKANARGMYVILDLHWSDVQGRAPCDAGCSTGQQPMPDADSLTLWTQVAHRYANDPGVIFDLYNEPHDVSWSCWLAGGCTTQSSPVTNGGTEVSYSAVGMQQLYNAVRAQGAENLVLVAGLDWAYDLSGVGAGYALSGNNIAYDTHIYTAFHDTVADWDQHVGYLTATHPVTATEFGSDDCSTAVTSQLLSYLQAKGISWTIWGWSAPGSCTQPSVLADWSGTPLAGQGQLIHDTLAALAG